MISEKTMEKANVPVLKQNKPNKRGNRKVKWIIVTLFISILTILFFRSSLSEVSEINFEGNKYVTTEQLMKAVEVQKGDAFFGTSSGTIEQRLEKVQSIQSVTVQKSFPGVINIQVQEYPVLAYTLDANGGLKGLLTNGVMIPFENGTVVIDKPILSQWKENDPNLKKLGSALSQIDANLVSDISEIAPEPTLSYPDRIKMYTRSHFVVISSISLLPKKAEYMNRILESQEPGILKLLDADSYVPFSTNVDTEK